MWGMRGVFRSVAFLSHEASVESLYRIQAYLDPNGYAHAFKDANSDAFALHCATLSLFIFMKG